jgi:hypothetical protein
LSGVVTKNQTSGKRGSMNGKTGRKRRKIKKTWKLISQIFGGKK